MCSLLHIQKEIEILISLMHLRKLPCFSELLKDHIVHLGHKKKNSRQLGKDSVSLHICNEYIGC